MPIIIARPTVQSAPHRCCSAQHIAATFRVNPDLSLLQPYPFERLRTLFARAEPAPAHDRPTTEIKLSIGEPQHATPALIKDALAGNLGGLATYPTTQGTDALRETIAAWINRRYALPGINPATQLLPVNGSREALFAFAQAVIERRPSTQPIAKVICPNPFYQIYEGAAYLAGAEPLFVNTLPDTGFAMDWSQISDATWRDVQLVFVCTPGNPTGKVMSLDDWRVLFELADRHDFVIASDECYSEIYLTEGEPPLGALAAAQALGRTDFRRLMMFSSLSKRSNVPGLRSGFVAGDAALIKSFLLYRTYQGGAMSPVVQAASIAAWNDEDHVIENRRLYARKFAEVTPLIAPCLPCTTPDAGFYLWASTRNTGLSDSEFALALHRQQNVVVLPGSFLGRQANGLNPGAGFVRIALVAEPESCLDAGHRISAFCRSL